MSSALYQTMLTWNGRLGLAKHRGVTRDLTTWPQGALPGVRVSELRYMPQIRDCEIRLLAGGWRQLEREEMAALLRWLNGMADAVDAYVDGGSRP